jgi:hypothetical protein
MKSRILQSVIPVLLVISFTPAVCRAQAEINPDHFDGISNYSAESNVRSNGNPTQAYGSFFLPSPVRYSGGELRPGYYSLSVRQLGRRDVVRLTPIVSGVRARAVEITTTPRLSPGAPGGLLVDRRRRTLTAISLQPAGVTLFLQTGKEAGGILDAEIIPIPMPSSTGRALPGNGD